MVEILFFSNKILFLSNKNIIFYCRVLMNNRLTFSTTIVKLSWVYIYYLMQVMVSDTSVIFSINQVLISDYYYYSNYIDILPFLTNSLNLLVNFSLDSFNLLIYDNSVLKGMDKFSLAHEFNYNSFLRSLNFKIQYVLSHNSHINTVESYSFSKNSSIFNLNMTSFWVKYTYLIYSYIKSHLAYYILLIYMLIMHFCGSLSSLTAHFNRVFIYILLLIIQAKPAMGLSFKSANILISGLGWVFYVNLMAVYDILYKNIKFKHQSVNMVRNGKLNFKFLRERTLLGIIFLFVINTGVLFSNSFYNAIISLLTLKYKLISIVLSLKIASIASMAWLYFNRLILGYNIKSWLLSYIRSIIESISFVFLSFANYIIWSLLPATFLVHLLTFTIGLISYFFFSYFQITFETNVDSSFTYGLIYDFVFTSLSLSSSGLFFLIDFINMNIWLKVIFVKLCFIIIVILPLEVYRFKPTVNTLGEVNNNNLVTYLAKKFNTSHHIVNYFIAMLHQLIVFFSFAISTFILLDLLSLTI